LIIITYDLNPVCRPMPASEFHFIRCLLADCGDEQ